MNGCQAFARIAAIGMLAGAATAPITGPAHAGLTLVSADGPLAGSDTAIIVGGTTQPTPSASFAQAVEELFLHPLGFADGATDSMVCKMSGTDPCSAPLQVLTTPELLQQGHSSLTGASDIALAVQNEFAADPGAFSAEHPLTVFGYSQGATAGSIAMTRLAEAGIPSGDLHFVFIGDPSTPGGVWPNVEADLDSVLGPNLTNLIIELADLKDVLGDVTPNDLYPATIYTLDQDAVPDWQQDFATGGLGYLLLPGLLRHGEYLGLTPSDVANATISTDGDITNVDISDDINNFGAAVTAFGQGLGDSGFFQSLFDSLRFALTGSF
ncbi:MAG TPA: PE-PPE domain-containing protein [Mycobacterium sp.]|nr:PE-PPE domain-containing protein [Mycobacterium sp.]